MAEGILEKTERRIEQAILRLAAYFAVFALSISEQEVNQYIGVTAGHLAIRNALKSLVADKQLILDDEGYYRLPDQAYHSKEHALKRQHKLLAKAESWARLFGIMPFVKSVVVVNSAAIGNVRADSDIDLLIVTTPNRAYVAKGILMYTLRLLRQLENKKHKAERFSLGMFITTAGVNWQRDIMAVNEPHLTYWLMLAKPVYGERVWYELMHNSPLVAQAFPNYVWPKSEIRVYANGFSWLDQLDSKGYKKHLKHTAGQPKMHTKEAFVRVRPDIINLHALDQSGKIAGIYKRIVKST